MLVGLFVDAVRRDPSPLLHVVADFLESGARVANGILRAGAVWVPINARNVVSENAYILDYCDVETLFYYSGFEANVDEIRTQCPKLRNFVCIEPMAGITNGINLAHRGVYKELQVVQPGGTWRESFWVRPSGF